jgi:hypothetical protein
VQCYPQQHYEVVVAAALPPLFPLFIVDIVGVTTALTVCVKEKKVMERTVRPRRSASVTFYGQGLCCKVTIPLYRVIYGIII